MADNNDSCQKGLLWFGYSASSYSDAGDSSWLSFQFLCMQRTQVSEPAFSVTIPHHTSVLVKKTVQTKTWPNARIAVQGVSCVSASAVDWGIRLVRHGFRLPWIFTSIRRGSSCTENQEKCQKDIPVWLKLVIFVKCSKTTLIYDVVLPKTKRSSCCFSCYAETSATVEYLGTRGTLQSKCRFVRGLRWCIVFLEWRPIYARAFLYVLLSYVISHQNIRASCATWYTPSVYLLLN